LPEGGHILNDEKKEIASNWLFDQIKNFENLSENQNLKRVCPKFDEIEQIEK
jgi:hypothetical protein